MGWKTCEPHVVIHCTAVKLFTHDIHSPVAAPHLAPRVVNVSLNLSAAEVPAARPCTR